MLFTLCMIVWLFLLFFLSLSLSFFDCLSRVYSRIYLCTGNLLLFYSSFAYRTTVGPPKYYFPYHTPTDCMVRRNIQEEQHLNKILLMLVFVILLLILLLLLIITCYSRPSCQIQTTPTASTVP